MSRAEQTAPFLSPTGPEPSLHPADPGGHEPRPYHLRVRVRQRGSGREPSVPKEEYPPHLGIPAHDVEPLGVGPKDPGQLVHLHSPEVPAVARTLDEDLLASPKSRLMGGLVSGFEGGIAVRDRTDSPSRRVGSFLAPEDPGQLPFVSRAKGARRVPTFSRRRGRTTAWSGVHRSMPPPWCHHDGPARDRIRSKFPQRFFAPWVRSSAHCTPIPNGRRGKMDGTRGGNNHPAPLAPRACGPDDGIPLDTRGARPLSCGAFLSASPTRWAVRPPRIRKELRPGLEGARPSGLVFVVWDGTPHKWTPL